MKKKNRKLIDDFQTHFQDVFSGVSDTDVYNANRFPVPVENGWTFLLWVNRELIDQHPTNHKE